MNENYETLWNNLKSEIKNFFTDNSIHMWLERISFQEFDSQNNKMMLSVPSNLIKDNVMKFKETMEYILSNLSGIKSDIEISVVKGSKHSQPIQDEKLNLKPNTLQIKPDQTISLNNQSKNPEKAVPNNEYTFENFVIGNSNEFAAEIARAIAREPGKRFNPFFIWGSSGLGKTHLMKSIEKYIKEHFPAKKVKYVTSEELTNDFLRSMSNKTQEQFRILYRSLDVLLLDDIQFLEDKPKTQEELFHTFNKLADSKKQMVFSCDQPVKQLKKMEERLKSRFAQGTTADLRPPGFELKMAIIKNMAEKNNVALDNDAMEYIGKNIVSNIRELIGAFQDVLAYSDVKKIKKITIDIVKDRLKDKIIKEHTTPISVDKIIVTVAEYYNLKASDLTGKKRTKSIAHARQVAMYISRVETRLSTTQIGTFFGDKEHATVMHATKKIEELLKSKDTFVKEDVDTIINKIKNEQ